MVPLLAILVDVHPSPVIRSLQFRDPGAPVPVPTPLGDPNTLVVIAADGAHLALRYMPTGELLHLLRLERLLPEVLHLHERSSWAYLLLDGTLVPSPGGKTVSSGALTGFAWSAVQGALLSIQELGVGLITLQDTAHLPDAITLLAGRDRTTMRLRAPRDGLFLTPAEDLLHALPGIGEERCQALLQYAGSAAWALDLLTDPQSTIPGIGDRLKAEARRALGLAEGCRLAVAALGQGEELDHELPCEGPADRDGRGTTNDHPTRRAA